MQLICGSLACTAADLCVCVVDPHGLSCLQCSNIFLVLLALSCGACVAVAGSAGGADVNGCGARAVRHSAAAAESLHRGGALSRGQWQRQQKAANAVAAGRQAAAADSRLRSRQRRVLGALQYGVSAAAQAPASSALQEIWPLSAMRWELSPAGWRPGCLTAPAQQLPASARKPSAVTAAALAPRQPAASLRSGS